MKRIYLIITFAIVMIFNGCSKNNEIVTPDKPAIKTVEVTIPKLVAHFKITNMVGTDMVTEGKVLNIVNDSKNAVSYKWDFANRMRSNLTSPEFTFLACGGPYTISLTAIDANGETATYSETYTVLCSGRTPTHEPTTP